MSETSTSSGIKVWMPVIIYVLIIFATTPFLPDIIRAIARFLNVPLKQFLVWLRDGVIVGLILFLIAIMASRERYKQQSAYAAMIIIFAWGTKLVSDFGSPAEATHFWEYGGLSILIFYKLRYNYLKSRSGPLYLAAALLTLGVGVLDELYQGWLPDRYYDFNDIIINVSSGILGLIYVWGVMRPGPLMQRVKSVLRGGHKGVDFP